ncbi:hypothetical protein BH11MYX1_BH11MYX1_10290 [soil metagenome]
MAWSRERYVDHPCHALPVVAQLAFELRGSAPPRYCDRMSPIETAVRTYEALWQERDSAARGRMIEACWAEDGRLVTRSTEIRGRVPLAAAAEAFVARGHTVRIISAIDAKGTTFRFRAVTLLGDGSTLPPEVFDAGMIDADGRISLILTFAGPLADA